ncbi:ABC transporter [Dyella jiangningensis]|nr:ABC transporter [Dyella jiangningensis]AHX15972.1 ABC transporter [Dyella jiangningensis]
MPSEPIIQVQGLGKRYEFDHNHQWSLFGRKRLGGGAGYEALHDINFDVQPGEAVGLIGRNGAGKSTLLQILTGTLRPSTGEVAVRGRVSALLELGAGFNPDFTGKENIYLTGAVLGMSSAEIQGKYQAIIDFADIGDFIDQPVKTYSSGMLVRLAFALQVHVDPDILIVDEALSVGDIFFQQKCINKIREILDRGVTLFFVSHGLNSVKSLCSRAIYLQKGRVVADGPAEEVCDLYQNSLTSHSRQDWEEAVEATRLHGGDAELPLFQVGEEYDLRDEGFEHRLSQRSGSAELVFTGVRVFDESGHAVLALEQSGPARIRLQLDAKCDIPVGASLGVLIRDANGVDLIAFNSNFYKQCLPALKKGQRYIWEIDAHLPLARGYYSIHCGVKPNAESGYFYDRCFNAAVLEIKGNPVSWGDYGGRLIQVPLSTRMLHVEGSA